MPWFFRWTLVVTLVAASLTVTLWQQTRPRWQIFESAEGKFRIDFPGPPEVDDVQSVEFLIGSLPVRTVGLTRRRQREAYVVRTVDIPAERVTGAPLLADACQYALSSMPDSHETERRVLDLNGIPALEVRATLGQQGFIIVRAVLARHRLFLLSVTTLLARTEPTEAERFLKSFQVTDATLRPIPRDADGRPKSVPEPTTIRDCVAYFPFDGPANAAIEDHVSGTARGERRLGLVNGAGVRGVGLSFDPRRHDWGGGKGVTNPHAVVAPSPGGFSWSANSEFTIAFWFRPRQEDGIMLSHRHMKDEGPMLNLGYGWGGRVFVQARTANSKERPVDFRAGLTASDGLWHHLALTRQSDGTIMLWLDGLPAETAARKLPGALAGDTVALGIDLRWAEHGGGSSGLYYTGDLDELAYYQRALSEPEIARLAGR